jgi:HK97 family phage prohead protease
MHQTNDMTATKKTLPTRVLESGEMPSVLITTDEVDRDGDVVNPLGIDTTNYMRNPVVCFAHQYDRLPIGRCVGLKTAATGIRATWRWLDGDEFATRVRNAWQQGVLGAASIGFRPIQSEPRPNGGTLYNKAELLEFSLVPVPANPAAIRALKHLGVDMPVETFDVDENDLREAMNMLRAALPDGLRRALRETLQPIVSREVWPAVARHCGGIVDGDEIVVELVDDRPGDPPVSRLAGLVKTGRVLSAVNEDRVRRAQTAARECDRHLADVLATVLQEHD